jgi:hypothetical protein
MTYFEQYFFLADYGLLVIYEERIRRKDRR